MKVLFITNIPSPYRVHFFNELGKLCDLTVLFEKHGYQHRDKSWLNYDFCSFKGVFLSGLAIGKTRMFCPEIIKYISDVSYDIKICTNFSSPTVIFAILYMKLRKIDYCIEEDGSIIKSGKGLKERIKKFLTMDAEGYFSTGKMHDKSYLFYGAIEERIFRYPFTSVASTDIYYVDSELKKTKKQQLGINENVMLVTVGQFIYRKGFDILLKAMAAIDEKCELYIIGGTPTVEYLELCQNMKLKNVHFVEFMDKKELFKYYQAADIFVFPTREDIWGLVINEAMSQSLPIISTDSCQAALELVQNGVNGYIVPNENIDILADRIKTLVNDETLREKMAKNNNEKIQKYTYENMARAHICVFETILGRRK